MPDFDLRAPKKVRAERARLKAAAAAVSAALVTTPAVSQTLPQGELPTASPRASPQIDARWQLNATPMTRRQLGAEEFQQNAGQRFESSAFNPQMNTRVGAFGVDTGSKRTDRSFVALPVGAKDRGTDRGGLSYLRTSEGRSGGIVYDPRRGGSVRFKMDLKF